MAAILTTVAQFAEGELASLLGTSIGKGLVGGLAGVAAGDVLNAIAHDLSGSNGGNAKAAASRAPKFAIVDLHSNKIVRTLSTRKVYSILTHPSRRSGTRGRSRTIVLRDGERTVNVK